MLRNAEKDFLKAVMTPEKKPEKDSFMDNTPVKTEEESFMDDNPDDELMASSLDLFEKEST